MLDYIRAVLSGRYYDGYTERRIYVNATKGLPLGSLAPWGVPPDFDQYQLSRDYDSIIGYSDNLPYSKPIGVYAVAPFKDSIRKDLHIKTRIRTVDVRSRSTEDRAWS